MACLLIFILSVIFYLFVAPWFYDVMDEREHPKLGLFILALITYFDASAVFWIYQTHVTDPGLIPRKAPHVSHPLHPRDDPTLNPSERLTQINKIILDPPKREIQFKEITLHEKWCYTCRIWRPPRASHCGECGGCILVHDHHCPWVGNCVGKKNYKFFVLFVYTTSTALFLMMAIAFSVLAHEFFAEDSLAGSNLPLFIVQNFASVICGVVGLMLGWSLMCLGMYHTYIILTDQTTRENMRTASYRARVTPLQRLNRGLYNMLFVFCAPRFVHRAFPRKLYLEVDETTIDFSRFESSGSESASDDQIENDSDQHLLLEPVNSTFANKQF